MDFKTILPAIIFIGGIIISVIGFFLKRTYDDGDKNKKDIQDIKEHYATKAELSNMEKSLKCENEKFQNSVERKLDDIQHDLKEVQINYIPKEEFFKGMTKIDNKLDRLTEFIIGNKGG
jgi:hypothetical protein